MSGSNDIVDSVVRFIDGLAKTIESQPKVEEIKPSVSKFVKVSVVLAIVAVESLLLYGAYWLGVHK